MNKLFCMFLLESVGIGDEVNLEIAGDLSITGLNPNPVSGYMSISLDLPGSPVEISVYDLLGRNVGTVSAEDTRSGENVVIWVVPSGIPDGIYLVRAVSGDAVSVSRFTLLRHR